MHEVGLGAAVQESDWDTEGLDVHITASYSLIQPIIAIVQAAYAGVTLYKTHGDQLEQFVFTAFGLIVAPYLLMSIINFVAQ